VYSGSDGKMTSCDGRVTSEIAAQSAMAFNPLPVNLYESLLSKLVIVLKLTHSEEGITTHAAKQAILQAVSVIFPVERARSFMWFLDQ